MSISPKLLFPSRRLPTLRSKAWAVVAIPVLIAACAPVPKLGPTPPLLSADTVQSAQTVAPFAASAATWPGDNWWRAMGDPQLDALIEEGLAGSPDVAAALARFDKAAALARQAGADRYPRLDLEGGTTLQKQSLNMGYPDAFKAFLPQGWNEGAQISANLGFDLDLWGRNRAAYAAANSDAAAAALDARAARLVLAAGIASAYADLSRLFAERDVRARQVEIAASSRKLLAERQRNGLENVGGVATSEAEVANARIALNQTEETLALRRNQLAALLGKGPDRGLSIGRPALAPASAAVVPETVTTDLLGRRADVVAARQRVEAAASRIKVARADFFPAIKLNALIGLQSLGLGKLFESDSVYGSVGPAISLPIFHGGALQGRYRGARADYDAAVAGYNGSVVAAYQQVADALTTSRLAAQRLADARLALRSTEQAYDVANARYKGGLSTYLEVLQVDDRRLQARLAVASLEAVVRNADIALARALGGGFAETAPGSAAGLSDTTKENTHG